MIAQIITIGDEILLGQTIDTNSAYLGKTLHTAGVSLRKIVSISDTKEAIKQAVEEALADSDLVLVTGGLGPTKDDITKETLCQIFDSSLSRRQDVYEKIERYFHKIGREMLETNAAQADLPDKATILSNDLGTAQGMLFERGDKWLLSMPGVPYEMRHIIETGLLPLLKERAGKSNLFYRVVLTKNLPESFLAQKIEDWENSLRAEGLALAYLPSPGLVKLRISTSNASPEIKARIEAYIEELKTLVPEHIFAEEDISLSEAVAQLLIQKKCTLSLAESCTGGLVSSAMVQYAGISSVYLGGVVAYSNDLKVDFLGVNEKSLNKYGAVSKVVVEQMARGIQQKTGSMYAMATSGVAGPEGGSKEKPVGLVHMAIAGPNNRVYHFEKIFGGDRKRIMNRAAQFLFSELWDLLQKHAE